MRVNPRYTLVVLASLCVMPVSGQTPGISPIPVILPGNTVPLDSEQFVFLGPRVSELTISYPSELDPGAAAGARRTYKVKMLNQVQPVVSTAVKELPDGTFEYVYTVRNGPEAQDAIKVLSLGLPATDALISAENSQEKSEWTATRQLSSRHRAPLPGAASMTPVMFSTWRDSGGSGIAPGQLVTTVKIRSAYRPGITILYARSGEDYDVEPNLPAAVRAQLDVMRAQEWQNKATVVVGPVFPADFSRDFIANELKYGIVRLAKQGQLREESQFVVEAQSTLEAISRAQGARIPLDHLLSAARTSTETEIANAISLSLR